MSLHKPPFEPETHVSIQDKAPSSSPAPSLEFTNKGFGEWVPVASCNVTYSEHEFSQVVDALVHYPERNSPLILRADVESDLELSHSTDFSALSIPGLKQFQPTRFLRRVLCPRKPNRDRALHQSCIFYTDQGEPTVLVLSPDLSNEHPTPPFFHPAVAHLAIRFTGTHLVVEVVPLVGSDSFTLRLVKTCLSLLENVYRVGYGFANGYRKRVEHDTMIDKAEFQDLYLKMKEMHSGLVGTWQEVTDPSKHVFEDIGIATFLMLLWNLTYRQGPDRPVAKPGQAFPWSHFARPPGGFRDMGCGNGLLTHILVKSGYEGLGIDLRARKSWASFSPETCSRLKVQALDFTSIHYDASIDQFTGLPTILGSGNPAERVFLIGNHADELTPWMPIIAHAARADFLSIPCCFWALDGRFHAQKRRDMPGPDCSAQPSPSEPWELALADRLHSVLGGTADANSGTKKGAKQPSQYGRYMLWLARLQRGCGFGVDIEALRIPSTRNWAFAGVSRIWQTDSERARVDEYVDELVAQVRGRGMFKTRVPEGKEGGFMTLYGL
ncbi:tRNA (uracil-O(2))-methyltransferase [Rhizoctonia solani AG-3 Rhs1AP]|uniref:tRNA (uracil-O(2)-)-methyltransferase n=1 Tax=Rhizoctonia solani AG-3 Rhs1AP TaxID=1086054 RepID=X8JBR2_9AGAM|nr:tRNA (uracil-O(2))-methyltransferase [Rhizoctonia solani AG-3 Rhs1AP]